LSIYDVIPAKAGIQFDLAFLFFFVVRALAQHTHNKEEQDQDGFPPSRE
jgi:hypothetical protein